MPPTDPVEWDNFTYIVVGAGPSGLLLVHELIRSGSGTSRASPLRVLLLESGGGDCDKLPEVACPQLWGAAASGSVQGRLTDMCPSTHQVSMPQGDLCGRNISCPVGTGVGGSGNINAMIWTAGHKEVFERYWPPSWSSEVMESLFSRVLEVVKPQYMGPFTSADDPHSSCHLQGLLQLARKKQVRAPENKQGPPGPHSSVWSDMATCSYWATLTLHDVPSKEPERLSLKALVLDPLLSEFSSRKATESGCKEVTVLTRCEVLRVIMQPIECSRGDGSMRASGVIVFDHVAGVERTFTVDIRNGGEVVLCAGVFGSPRILATSLEAPCENPGPSMRTSCEKEVDGGKNCFEFFDHTVLPFMALGNWASMTAFTEAGARFDYVVSRIDLPPNCVHGWVYLDEFGRQLPCRSDCIPCCQLLFVDGRVLPGLFCSQVLPLFSRCGLYTNYIRPFLFHVLEWIVGIKCVQWLLSCTFGVLMCRVQPPIASPSCGRLTKLRGSQTESAYLIDFQNSAKLSWSERLQPMYHALSSVRSLCNEYRAKSGRAFWFLELLPGPLFLYCYSSVTFEVFYKLFVGTYFHYCGTIRMETVSPESCPAQVYRVDERLRVRGVHGLRVADASVFPWIPSAPIAATAMAVGVNAARLILGRQ